MIDRLCAKYAFSLIETTNWSRMWKDHLTSSKNRSPFSPNIIFLKIICILHAGYANHAPFSFLPSPPFHPVILLPQYRKFNYWSTYTHWNDQIPAASPLMIIESPTTHIHSPEVISCEELIIASSSQLLRTLFNCFLSGLLLFFWGVWGGKVVTEALKVSHLNYKSTVIYTPLQKKLPCS